MTLFFFLPALLLPHLSFIQMNAETQTSAFAPVTPPTADLSDSSFLLSAFRLASVAAAEKFRSRTSLMFGDTGEKAR